MLRRWEGVSGEGRFSSFGFGVPFGFESDGLVSLVLDGSGGLGLHVALEDDEAVARA